MLPHGLLDLTFTSATRYGARRGFSVLRTLRNVETVSTTPATGNPQVWAPTRGRRKLMLGNMELRERKAPSQALQELDEMIHALEELAVEEESEDVLKPEAYYTERELAAFYTEVLANPFEGEKDLKVNEQAIRAAQAEEDKMLVQAMYERFDAEGTSSSVSHDDDQRSNQPVEVILSRLDSIVSRLEAAERISGSENVNEEQTHFPVSILTMRECEALVRVSTWNRDAKSAEQTLQLMKRTGLPIPEVAYTSVLQLYGRNGDPVSADRFVSTFLAGTTPNDDQRHHHIQAHLKSTPTDLIPLSALELVHSYENRNLPAPMWTYTTVISELFHRPSSIARGQAWDLFSHMRYVAHPDPSVPLYTLMIKACAYPLRSTLPSEPEKALDLWTEMTVDNGLIPTVASYNAVILACARAGTKEFVGEAFKLARQMLDSHRDAQGHSAYRPDRKTFSALLEGAKRLGDLSRVRWILAEMTRSEEGLESLNAPMNAQVDEEIMVHVFNAYAAYKPPFIKAKTMVIEDNTPKVATNAQSGTPVEETSASSQTVEESSETDSVSSTTANDSGTTAIDHETPIAFAHIPPQTHTEVLDEAKFLFESIRDSQDPSSAAARKFGGVHITPRLVTAYLSVFYAHSSLASSRELFWSLYDEVGVKRPVRAYVEALERCANARKTRDGGHERELALKYAGEIWKEWSVLEAVGKEPHSGANDGAPPKLLEARTIERANIALIKTYTLNNELDQALSLVRAFVARYPPQSVRETAPPKPALRSTRTVLGPGETAFLMKPLVRMTGATEVGDDYVPPMLMWKDVESLHHRLVAWGRLKDVGYLKWVGKAYEWAVRVRRDEVNRAVPKLPKAEEKGAVKAPAKEK